MALELIIGPMYAGKSTELLRKVNRHKFAGLKCILLTYIEDQRYTTTPAVCTHDKICCEAIASYKIGDVLCTLDDYSVVGIDEGQFFPDLVEATEVLIQKGKTVIVAGLSGTFEMKPFENIAQLISRVDNLTKLSAVCMGCGADAPFTARTNESKELKMVGGLEAYKSVCRRCHTTVKRF